MNKKAILLMLFCLLAIACFKKAPLNENALLHQRACIESIEIEDHIRAKTHCEICLEFDNAMPECLNGLGLIALMEKDDNKAKAFFSKALRQDNDFSQARNNLGVIYFTDGDFSEALKYFDRALEIDPANVDARYNSGLSHFRLGQKMIAHGLKRESFDHLIKAKDQIKKLLAIEPSYHSAYRDLGLIDLSLHDLSEFDAEGQERIESAKKSFKHCLSADKENDGCYEGLAEALFLQGQFDQSFANYFLCLSFAPNNHVCKNGIAKAFEKGAHREGGYQGFSKLVSAEQDNAPAHEAFCAALFERGLYQEAVKECELALRLKPDLCSAQFRLAEHFAQILDPKRATHHCQAFFRCDQHGVNAQTKKCQEILTLLR